MNEKADLTEIVRKQLSEKRFKHSVSTAELSETMCIEYSQDSTKGYIAGLLHDIGRERPQDELIRLAGEEYAISEEEYRRPRMLHGKAGSVIVKNEFGIRDSEILEAVAYHVTGNPGMGPLAVIVFIADYLEPERYYPTASLREQIGSISLEKLLCKVMNEIFAHLRNKGKQIATPALQLYRETEEKVSCFEKKERI
jgi:nicotinate-nucleotide adenylyltransferase